jgi:hypothetical protein
MEAFHQLLAGLPNAAHAAAHSSTAVKKPQMYTKLWHILGTVTQLACCNSLCGSLLHGLMLLVVLHVHDLKPHST